MQLFYKILWIDNDLQEYIDRGSIQRLKDYLVDLGFMPQIVTLFDETELDTYLNKIKFDLIISDYQLDNTTGDKIVEHIRDKKILTEILFYSAKENFRDEIGEKLKFVDRISIQLGRDTLLERIENLITLTLDKLLELNATRGLITAITSELDVDMVLIGHATIDATDIDNVEKIFTKIHKEISKKHIKDFAAMEQIFAAKNYKEYFTRADAFRKFDLLKQIIKLKVPAGFDYDLLINYYDQVISIRNKFAHAKAIIIGDKLHLSGFGADGTAFEFDETQCVEIRKKLIGHRNNFDGLLKHFNINGGMHK